ncbi:MULTISPECIES: Cu(I)-responsive transcriptional regulator [Alcaligenes]|uniref:Cu(I)-responsive transcriptional regulator n=1 Tax=Alcaligenes phenolicus TaxID=232846 RepID=A0AAW5W447_9BURK|nr:MULTISPECIES: Cu(I)-responsive transcriptional regulator [Alcaligenes]KAA1287231.1 Cu(I)-responsive transcriptional regulator [Alcaligenes faecalis]MCR4145656.1 Cu(I)-responsive transcriptional regulator [Alcaligenes faecalis]MCX5567142.1 Cu(I)-responsive transcriptional regulator [Alcaligenes phenolicus]OSZ32344.1 Cu(I)-responsive transcriptional regulator [Alcaligenes faecalis]OSZ40751.1 Cu(I)-responsive transcriptional regulator [Alcaligenes faecalis]
MNIGEASKVSKVSAKMIRYYEQIGLIPETERTAAGYRTYSRKDVERLRFIRRARDLGFSMVAIGDLLSLWHDPSRQSADVKRVAQQHLTELSSRIKNMQEMALALEASIGCCPGDEQPDCSILSTLAQAEDRDLQPDLRAAAVLRRPVRRGIQSDVRL